MVRSNKRFITCSTLIPKELDAIFAIKLRQDGFKSKQDILFTMIKLYVEGKFDIEDEIKK